MYLRIYITVKINQNRNRQIVINKRFNDLFMLLAKVILFLINNSCFGRPRVSATKSQWYFKYQIYFININLHKNTDCIDCQGKAVVTNFCCLQ